MLTYIALRMWHVLTSNHTVLPATHHTFMHEWNEPSAILPLIPQPQRITALWLVLTYVPQRVGG